MDDKQPAPTGPNRADLAALKEGAATLLRMGNRVAALSLLWSAVAIDPTDDEAHRHLAAMLTEGGDRDGAANEYARYIEFLLPLGEITRAVVELQHAAALFGPHPALQGAAAKIGAAVSALVTPGSAALAAPAAPARAELPVTPRPLAATLPAPRLLPKVPFRFCLHTQGDAHWMQLEGGAADLVPDAVRVVDRRDQVVAQRLCLPMRDADHAHAPRPADAPKPVTWVVLQVPAHVVAAYESGRTWSFVFQGRVHGEWLALDLIDSGCRLGRERQIS